MSEDRTTEIADDDELTFEVVKPLGGVVSVRFNGEEMRQLRAAVQRSDTTVSALIKQATLGHIALMDYEREARASIQSADDHGLWTLWVTSGSFAGYPLVLNDHYWLEQEGVAEGWNGSPSSGSMPPMEVPRA